MYINACQNFAHLLNAFSKCELWEITMLCFQRAKKRFTKCLFIHLSIFLWTLCDMMTNSVKKFCCCLSLALSYFIAKKFCVVIQTKIALINKWINKCLFCFVVLHIFSSTYALHHNHIAIKSREFKWGGPYPPNDSNILQG